MAAAKSPMSAHRAMIYSIGKHLEENMPRLEQVLFEFPGPNLKLKYPSLTVTSGNPAFSPLDPYLLSQGETDNHKASVKRVVGRYDLNMQLDFWARNKEERYILLEEFFVAFNSQVEPMGLSLQLEDYHDLWCRFSMDGYTLEDGEVSSQRGEWRARVAILANTMAVIEKDEFIIETVQSTLRIEDSAIDE